MSDRYSRERDVAIRAVRQASRLCRAVRAEISPEVLAKRDKSPVTVADFGSQAVICRTLAEVFPDDPVMAEEDSIELRQPSNAPLVDQVLRHVRAVGSVGDQAAADLTAEEVCRWIDHGGTSQYHPRFWTLDPIDGTKGFLRAEQYAVALALIVDGQVAVAALACPSFVVRGQSPGAVFIALRGQGAFVWADDGTTAELAAAEPVRVSGRADPATARFCESVESGHSAHGDAAAIAARLGITTPPLRLDSQAKYAVVARGEAEAYLRLPTRADYREKIWDHAAGALIVAEAGGTVTDIHGRPLEFHHGRELTVNRGVIVTNGRLHQQILEAVQFHRGQ